MKRIQDLTQIELMTEVHYSPNSGVFTQLNPYAHRPVNAVIGTLTEKGYLRATICNKKYYLHRLAFLYMTGELPPEGLEIDHVNGIGADNRWTNLRLATKRQNCYNRKSRSPLGIKGLSLMFTEKGKRKYLATIRVEGKLVRKNLTNILGTPEEDKRILTELVSWIDELRRLHHGEFYNDGLGGED